MHVILVYFYTCNTPKAPHIYCRCGTTGHVENVVLTLTCALISLGSLFSRLTSPSIILSLASPPPSDMINYSICYTQIRTNVVQQLV